MQNSGTTKKRLYINKGKFSKEKLSIQYSPQNLESIKKGMASLRKTFYLKYTCPLIFQNIAKAYSNSPVNLHANYQKINKRSLGFRRGSNISSQSNSKIFNPSIKFSYVNSGSNTTKGQKKIEFQDSKSSILNRKRITSKLGVLGLLFYTKFCVSTKHAFYRFEIRSKSA